MSYEVRIGKVDERPLAVVRRRASLHELSTVVPQASGEVWNVIKNEKLAGAGRHVASYLDNQINLEIGVEMGGPFAGHDDVVPSATSAGTVATATHLGPYGQLGQTHDAKHAWCKNNGYQLAGPNWEVYGHWQDEWNHDPGKIRTDVSYLLNGDTGSDA